ncbi:OsmC family protein [Streptomyces kaniharaensis]|uniref:OsmC family protein n=1 Tax=Streptomyces kaniharaensis TaxID=212423 RepID=UPI002DDCD275|nr:OsmC family protein [Streptomyces kaniharaensis]
MIARQQGVVLSESSVTATVSLLALDDGGFTLAVRLRVDLPGMDQGVADELVKATHQVCPYSNATRGNVEVDLSATV